MGYLLLTTCIWAFSFSLIGHYLSGVVDNYFAIVARFFLAGLVFLPFMRFRSVKFSLALQLMGIGALQIGVMYLFYYNSFLYLDVNEVALFTIFTPFYVSIFYDICVRRFRALYIFSVGIAVFGAFLIKQDSINSDFLIGFLLVQGANIAFGIGQSLYKVIIEKNHILRQSEVFGYFYFGALIVALVAFGFLGDFHKLPINALQWGVLLYLGIVASGLGYFFWNKGASLVDSGVLAIMNNAIIPMAIIVNIVFWGSQSDYLRLFLGSVLIFFSLMLHYKLMQYYQQKVILK